MAAVGLDRLPAHVRCAFARRATPAGSSRRPLYDSKQIHSTVRADASTSLWAGNGAKVHYERYPTGLAGARTYDKVYMYRQGLEFHFHTTGTFFKFDAQCKRRAPTGGVRIPRAIPRA